MKTTFVLTQKEINKFKLTFSNFKEHYIDYFHNRKKLIRWYKYSSDSTKNNRFFEKKGLIDISIEYTTPLSNEDAKKELKRKDIKYLVNRIFVSIFEQNNISGKIYRVIAEDVQNNIQIFEEYHLIIDNKYDEAVDFSYVDKFFGNIYDYIEQHISNNNI